MWIALTRELSPALSACELTHLPRVAIDLERARAQHRDYEAALTRAGCEVRQLGADASMPDSVFIEDTALVFDPVAVITRPGAESRRVESAAVIEALRPLRPLRFIEAPGTLDGGDVLVAGTQVWVGQTARSNLAGIGQLRRHLEPFGFSVRGVPVTGCLHLKSAVTAVGPRTLLLNPDWVSPGAFEGAEWIEVHPEEPAAANVLRIGDTLLFPTAFPLTRQRLEQRGLVVESVEASELAKAEGALTCCSLIFRA